MQNTQHETKSNGLPPLAKTPNEEKKENQAAEEKGSSLPPMGAQPEKKPEPAAGSNPVTSEASSAAPQSDRKEEKTALEIHQEKLDEMEAKEALAREGLSGNILEYDPDHSLNGMLQGAKVLISSGILPNNYSEPEQVVAAVKMGSEYGFSAMVALNNIHIIQGKPTLSVHMITALLEKGGWRLNIEQQATPENNWVCVMGFTNFEGINQLNEEIVKADELSDSAKSIVMENLMLKRKALAQTFSYSWQEAAQMGIAKKDNQWGKQTNTMCRSRAITLGARVVAGKLLMGMMEATEMLDVKAAKGDFVNYEVDDEGNLKEYQE